MKSNSMCETGLCCVAIIHCVSAHLVTLAFYTTLSRLFAMELQGCLLIGMRCLPEAGADSFPDGAKFE